MSAYVFQGDKSSVLRLLQLRKTCGNNYPTVRSAEAPETPPFFFTNRHKANRKKTQTSFDVPLCPLAGGTRPPTIASFVADGFRLSNSGMLNQRDARSQAHCC